MKKLTWIGAVLLSLSLSTNATAQVNASILGTVTDQTGALIPGAEVTATNVNTGITTLRVSNETGSYNIPSLQAGTYTVSTSLPGFQTQTQGITLSQGQQVRLNFDLAVGAVGTVVEVIADADALLATTTASVGDVLPTFEVTSLPLAERDVFDLIETTAGAVGFSFGGQRSSAVNVTRDGMLVNDTRYLTSAGALTATYSSPDLVEEVQLVVGAIDAEAGRGSGQISFSTRSGGNQFHGALFYSNNNSALNANSWFNNLRDRPKDYLNRSQYGGRVGGPIIQNRLFFFVLVDNQRYVRKQDTVATVLTAQARQGIFRYWPGVENDNALGGAGASVDRSGNPTQPTGATGSLQSFNVFTDVNDPNRPGLSTNAYMKRTLAAMPVPNDFTTGDGLNTAGHAWTRRRTGEGAGLRVGNNTHRDQLNYRIDLQLNDSNRMSFINSREENKVDSPTTAWPTGYSGLTMNQPGIWTATWTSTITPTLLNDFRLGWKKTSSHNRSAYEIGCCFGTEFEDRSPEAEELFATLPHYGGVQLQPEASIWGDGLAGHGFGSTRGQDSPAYQLVENVSWTSGTHSFKSGFEYIWNWSDGWNTTSEQFPEAILGDGGVPVVGINSTNFPGLAANDAGHAEEILNDLSGSIERIEQGFVLSSASQTQFAGYGTGDFRRFREFHKNDYAFFFKDTWSVTNNLTLNLGMRYDVYGSMFEENGLATNTTRGEGGIFSISGSSFDDWFNRGTTSGLTAVELVAKNSPNPDKLFWPEDRNNFAPSIGFSYAMPGGGTVLRGGFGVNYAGAIQVLDYELSFGNVPGTVNIQRFSPSIFVDFDNVGTLFPLSPSVAPFAAATLTERTADFDVNSDDRRTPYTYNWNVSIQRDLGNNMTLEATYIGNKATQLLQVVELNEPDINASFNGSQTFLAAFNQTRAGGDAPLFDQMLNGIKFGSVTVGTNGSGSAALRKYGRTDNLIADGEVAELAEYMNSTRTGTGSAGGLLRTNGFPENFIMVSPQFDDAQIWGSGANSTYHSLQLQVRKRLSSGVSGQMSYTWSKALGSAIGTGTSTGGGDNDTTTGLDPKDRSRMKGRLGFDRAHAFNAHGTWELPFGPGRALLSGAPSAVARIVEGWQLSSIFTYSSGAPLSIRADSRTVTANQAQSTPNLVGSLPKDFGEVVLTSSGPVYFEGLSRVSASSNFGADPNNLAADFSLKNIVDSSGNVILTHADPGKVGDFGLRYLSGPGTLGIDVAMQKRIQLTEGTSFTLRTDAINLLNKPQWGNPNIDMGSSSFGRISSATGQRTFTINARIDF